MYVIITIIALWLIYQCVMECVSKHGDLISIGVESPINPELVHRMLEDAMEAVDGKADGLER